MAIRIGYACINTRLQSSNRTCRLANATPERVVELGRQNLNALAAILEWNHQHGVHLFRISSEIIPLASHPAVTAPWWDELAPELSRVGEIIRATGSRVSMHPGQFTVLNSPRAEVVAASLAEMEYHARLLDLLGTDASCKIVLHLGGVYGDRAGSLRRFAENAARLSEGALRRLVLENDEKSYTVEDTLSLSQEIGVPVVFDVFHHRWNPSLVDLALAEIVDRCAATWRAPDGPPKLHYSDPWPGKPKGSHSQSVDVEAFGRFYDQIRGRTLDIMLEVKDKEQSVLALRRRFTELG